MRLNYIKILAICGGVINILENKNDLPASRTPPYMMSMLVSGRFETEMSGGLGVVGLLLPFDEKSLEYSRRPFGNEGPFFRLRECAL